MPATHHTDAHQVVKRPLPASPRDRGYDLIARYIEVVVLGLALLLSLIPVL